MVIKMPKARRDTSRWAFGKFRDRVAARPKQKEQKCSYHCYHPRMIVVNHRPAQTPTQLSRAI